MAVSSSIVLRVRGLPSNRNVDEVTSLLESSLQIEPEASGLKITSLAEDPYQVEKQVATLMFLRKLPPLFTSSTTNQWSMTISEVGNHSESDGDLVLTFDTHFHGLTALSTPSSKEGAVDCVAVCGLGGHAFGSFKEKGTSYMWLRDSLPRDLPNLRVMLYGYESGLDGSDSNQNVSVIADSFVGHLGHLRSQSKYKLISTPLIIIAHSLGGLVVKQAIIKLGHGNEQDKKQMESVVGLLFFGVPNRGMNIESLQAIVGDRQNRYLLESVGQYSDLLLHQDGQFGSTFHFQDSRVVSFFETKSSPTAININDSWKMAGPRKVLVTQYSATRPRLWESDDEGFNRTHSDLVKFSVNDVDYQRVLNRLQGIATKATAILTSRYLSQESPAVLNADEEACLRSLSFAELYARESIIEPAIQDTGSWLLESQNFQDWIQRKKLDEHRGFFWIQGNPGSGKSTLMKKVYSHVTACPQDPSSIIAAFFFNARGNEIEKSPTGLFRTLLHTLCQQISALRGLVVKTYVAKRKTLSPDWQWQLSELKGLLAAAVTSSVLGQRTLLLFVDALDECDLTATQSVIQMFEDLASSSLSEGTNFNICLSSRYWPQFRIQHCFVARVELENKGDIVRYIQKHLESTPIQEEDLKLLNALKIEILERAKGTFLWIVLVTQDLLNANGGGATLSELRNIVQRVPPDLSQFYQHQLQTTKSGDRERMLRLLQLVFYAQRPLSPIELRDALAFGSQAYASYAEWSQSSEYVRSDEQMEKRIREHSKGLVEIAPAEDGKYAQNSVRSRKAVVQFIHQSVRDYLTANGFSFLRDSRRCIQRADGHEFIKTACFNYLRIKDLEAVLEVDFRVYAKFDLDSQLSKLEISHPLLEYMVQYIFEHAAKAEAHGVSQDAFIAYMYNNTQRCFERWSFLAELRKKGDHDHTSPGPETRPITNLAEYGLITREIAEKERNIDKGGRFRFSALNAACLGGHQNAVQILLEFGADPRLEGTSLEGTTTLVPFYRAVRKQHLPVLRQLLNDHRSCLTLQERLDLAGSIRNEKPLSKAILDVLFPEATFPDSAIYDVCHTARDSDLGQFSFLLDKSPDSIVHEEILWHDAIGGSSPGCMSIIRALLDRGGTVKITGTLLDCLDVYRDPGSEEASEVLSLLLEHCDAEMTEDLIDSMCCLEDSSKTIRTFEAAGHRFDPFTPQRLLFALQFGNAESAAFFIQNSNGNTSVDEMLESALSNDPNGEEVTRLLLGYLNPDQINEQAIIAAVSNEDLGGDLIRLLHSRWSSLTFSEAALTVAVRWLRSDDIEFILERCEVVRVTEEMLTGAARQAAGAQDTINLLLLHDPDISVQGSTVIAAIEDPYQAVEILEMFCRHRKSLPCTESIIAATVNCVEGPKALKIVLEENRGALISSSMIMMAMQAKRGALLIPVMLDHDHTIVMNEEHLIAAASNRYDPSTIFEFLQTKGKLANTNLASEVLNTGAAKRRRISHKSSPRISRNVINAAFSNPSGVAKHRLLTLFLRWGIITETDYNNTIHIPPLSIAPIDTRITPHGLFLPSPLLHHDPPTIRSTSLRKPQPNQGPWPYATLRAVED